MMTGLDSDIVLSAMEVLNVGLARIGDLPARQ